MLDFQTLIIPAFIAGVLTFIAPCTLPLVPGYLGFISGVSPEELKNPLHFRQARRRIFANGAAFVLGFSLVFVVLGTLLGFVGASLLAPYRIWLARIGGVFVILFGLTMLGVLKLPFLNKETRFRVPAFFEKGRPLNSLVIGSAFAFGWTPCVGPILGSILLLASTSQTALQGGALLAIFSAGLAVPFLLLAWGIGSASRFVTKIAPFFNAVSVVGGLLLVFLGVLLLTDNMSLLISWGYQLLRFINYESLLDYL